MITILFGIVMLAVASVAIGAFVRSTPTTATRIRAQRKEARKTRRAAKRAPNASRGRGRLLLAPVLAAAGSGISWAVNRVRTAPERRAASAKASHEKAKEEGRTAATAPFRVVDAKRSWRTAWDDVKENLTRRDVLPPAEPPPEAAPPADQTPAQTTTTTDHTEEEPMPTYANLFEQGDQLVSLPFEHVLQIEGFTQSLRAAAEPLPNTYFALAARMSGPMNIDVVVTEKVESCGAHQRAIAAAVGDADANLRGILNSSTEELLERGIQVPPPHLVDGDASRLAALVVPQFFETALTLAGRTFQDIRGVHALLKSLRVASESQSQMYTRIAIRLEELKVDASVAESYRLAARHQDSISMNLSDADTNMTRLLTMTVRELANSPRKAPNAHLTGV